MDDEISISTKITQSRITNNINNRNEISLENIPTIQNPNNEENEENQELIKEYQFKKLLDTLKLPTTDDEIKKKLRELGEPIILFGEKIYERQDRLKKHVLDYIKRHNGITDILKEIFQGKKKKSTIEINEEFYTEGTEELLQMRKNITKFSLINSIFRLNYIKKNNTNEYESLLKNYINNKSNYQLSQTQNGDTRFCTRGSISFDDKYYGVAGCSSNCTIFSTEKLNIISELIGHKERVNSLLFNPYQNINDEFYNILTSSNDKTIRLWNVNFENENDENNNFSNNINFNNQNKKKPIIFKGHEDRVNYSEFHPIKYIFGSCSHDKTIRLWDINYQKEILLQEGHSYYINSISFQNDGSLLGSGDYGGIGIIWDLRLGKKIINLLGHAKQIIKIKFHPNNYQVLTTSEDNTIMIWDLRKEKCVLVIPAHNNSICDLTFDKGNFGVFNSKIAFSCSFDSNIKIWNMENWSLINTLSFDGEKVFSVDVTKNLDKIICSSLGREIKMWELKKEK